MKKPSFLFILIVFLALTATSLVIWKLVILRQPGNQGPALPTPTPASKFILPTPSLQEGRGDSQADILKSLKQKFPLVEFLPYETEQYSVDYIAPLHLQVKIKEASQSAQLKKSVEDWIWSKGVNPSTHQIDWIIPGP